MEVGQSLQIAIPETHVLISKQDLRELLDKADQGIYVDMKWLVEQTSRSEDWWRPRLYKYRNKLDVEKGGFVQYPPGGYLFHKEKMKRFLDQYFKQIVREEPL